MSTKSERRKNLKDTIRELYITLKMCEDQGRKELFEETLENNTKAFYKLIYGDAEQALEELRVKNG